MNQHKRIGLFTLFLTFAYLCCSVSAFATVITPEDIQRIIDQQQASSKAAVSNSSGTAKSNSSASSRRTHYASSSEVSSEETSSLASDSSDLYSSQDSSSEIVLPSVGSIPEDNPLSSVAVNREETQKMNWIGMVSWICIALGIIVVLIVLFSNRRPPNGPGRKRYRRPNRSHKKRLLNEKYYRNIKY